MFNQGELRERQTTHHQHQFDEVQLFDDRSGSSAGSIGGVQQQQPYDQGKQATFHQAKSITAFNFLYNKRIVPVLLLSVIPVLTLAGKYSLFVLLMGLLAMYTLDFLQQKASAFITLWVSLCFFWACIYTTSVSLLWVSLTNIFVLLNGSLYVIMCGLWASLQSEWFKTYSPQFAMTVERLLFAALPIVSLPLVLSVVVGLVGVANAPFYLCGLLCLYLYVFGKREVSSFSSTTYIQNPIQSRILVSMCFLLPSIMHICIYHNSFFDNFGTHLYTLNCLVALSMLFVSSDPDGYMWAFADSAYNMNVSQYNQKVINLKTEAHNSLRYLIQIVSAILLNFWVEFRVILPRYHYLIPLGNPWDKILVFAILNGLSSIIFLIVYNQNSLYDNKSKVGKSLVSMFAIAGAFFASILLGLPFYLIPFPLIAMYFLVDYLYSKQIRQYLIFTGCTAICAIWFMAYHFWYLQFEFSLSFLPFDWSLRMTHSTILIVVLLTVSILAVPFSITEDGAKKGETSVARDSVLIVQVVLLALMEQLLYEQGEGFYSPMLVIITSGLGVVFTKRLFSIKLISINIASVLVALYVSKLAIMLTQEGTYGAFICAVVTTLAFSRLYFATITDDSEKTFKSNPLSSLIYILMSGVTLFITRHVLLRNVLSIIIDTRFYEMNESHLFGFFCIAWGVSILPLSVNFMKNNPFVKRLNVLLFVVGLIISVLQPSLAFLSYSDITSSSISGSVGFAGDFNSLGKTSESFMDFIPWIVIVTVFALFSMDIISLNEKSNPVIRALFFVLVAAGFSISFSGLYLYYARIWTHISVLIVMVIASLIIYTTHFPLHHSYKTSLYLFGSWIAVLPIAYLSISVDEESLKQKNSFLGNNSVLPTTYLFVIAELTKSARIAIIGLYCALSALIAILIKFKLIGYPLIRIRKPGKVMTGSVENSDNMLGQNQTLDPYLSVPGADELSVVNNGATISCFILCIILTTWLNPDRYEAYLLFCAIFLLLNRDSQLLSEFKDTYRFVFVLLSMEISMAMFFMIDTVLFFSTAATSPSYTLDEMVSQFSLKFLLLLLTLPSHGLFVRFLMKLHKPNIKPLLVALPFSTISALLTLGFALYLENFYSLIYITLSAVAASVLQAMISAQYVREQIILL